MYAFDWDLKREDELMRQKKVAICLRWQVNDEKVFTARVVSVKEQKETWL